METEYWCWPNLFAFFQSHCCGEIVHFYCDVQMSSTVITKQVSTECVKTDWLTDGKSNQRCCLSFFPQLPVVAVVGSGGGTRAMTGLYGSLKGLQRLGLLDAMSYITGVSGSTWWAWNLSPLQLNMPYPISKINEGVNEQTNTCQFILLRPILMWHHNRFLFNRALATLYQEADWSQCDMDESISAMEGEITKSFLSAFTPEKLQYYRHQMAEKEKEGHMVSLIDMWGLVIEHCLYGKVHQPTVHSYFTIQTVLITLQWEGVSRKWLLPVIIVLFI